MKDIRRVVTIIVGAFIAYLAYKFWFGSGIFNGFFRPSVESGKLGAGGADFLSQLLEIVLTILSTIGGLGIAISLRLIKYLSSPFESAATTLVQTKQANSTAQSFGIQSEQQMGEYMRVLQQSIIEKDKAMTIALVERIAGEKYITNPMPKVQIDGAGFPVTPIESDGE